MWFHEAANRSMPSKSVNGFVWRNAVQDFPEQPSLNRFQQLLRGFDESSTAVAFALPTVKIMAQGPQRQLLFLRPSVSQPGQLFGHQIQPLCQFSNRSKRSHFPLAWWAPSGTHPRSEAWLQEKAYGPSFIRSEELLIV